MKCNRQTIKSPDIVRLGTEHHLITRRQADMIQLSHLFCVNLVDFYQQERKKKKNIFLLFEYGSFPYITTDR